VAEQGLDDPGGRPAVSTLLGIGIDVVEVARLRGLLARLPAAERRLFTRAESDYCRKFADPAVRFAARVAVKEAVGKAVGTGIVAWKEIEVVGGGEAKPRVRLHGATAAAARRLGIHRVEVSLSHTAAQAVAVAAALAAEGSAARAASAALGEGPVTAVKEEEEEGGHV
jgi:holo-[acyl-carrier protein] synthase